MSHIARAANSSNSRVTKRHLLLEKIDFAVSAFSMAHLEEKLSSMWDQFSLVQKLFGGWSCRYTLYA